MKKHLIWLFLLVTPLLATDSVVDIQVARKEIQAQTIEIVGTAMNLDPADESAFWAIYKDYEVERTSLGDVKVALLNQFMAIAENMTDEQAQLVAQHHFAMQRDVIALSEKYFGIMSEKLSPRLAARFVQIMNQVDTVIDANLSGEMALIGGF